MVTYLNVVFTTTASRIEYAKGLFNNWRGDIRYLTSGTLRNTNGGSCAREVRQSEHNVNSRRELHGD
jgi:hypothetical protein